MHHTSKLVEGYLTCIDFTARRNASAVYAIVLCLCVCVCLSQVGVLSKQSWRIELFLAWELPSTYPTLCFKEIWWPKVRTLPSGILTQILDRENFTTACRSSLGVVNKDGRQWALFIAHSTVDRRCYTLTVHTVYYASVGRNTNIAHSICGSWVSRSSW